MTIIHLGTRVETLFGVLDADGNVVKQIPLRAEMPVVDPERLAQVGVQMQLQRKRLEAEEAGAAAANCQTEQRIPSPAVAAT